MELVISEDQMYQKITLFSECPRLTDPHHESRSDTPRLDHLDQGDWGEEGEDPSPRNGEEGLDRRAPLPPHSHSPRPEDPGGRGQEVASFLVRCGVMMYRLACMGREKVK